MDDDLSAIALLGKYADLEQPHHGAQSDVRWKGARLVHRAHPRSSRSRLLPQTGHPSPRRRSSRSKIRAVRRRCMIRDARRFTPIDLCFPTHHLQFDKEDRLWFSAGGPQASALAGSIRGCSIAHMTRPHPRAGRRSSSTPMAMGGATIMSSPMPGRSGQGQAHPCRYLWCGAQPGRRLCLGFGAGLPWRRRALRTSANMLSEYYEVPWKDERVAPRCRGFAPRGMDIDERWRGVGLAGERPSRELRSPQMQGTAQRAKCDRPQCPEGWTLHQLPGPEFESVKGTPGTGAEASYYAWVDQHDTFGLGANIPIATGNESDALTPM